MDYEQLIHLLKQNGISSSDLANVLQKHFTHEIDLEWCGVELGIPANKEKIERYHRIIDDLREAI